MSEGNYSENRNANVPEAKISMNRVLSKLELLSSVELLPSKYAFEIRVDFARQ